MRFDFAGRSPFTPSEIGGNSPLFQNTEGPDEKKSLANTEKMVHNMNYIPLRPYSPEGAAARSGGAESTQ